MTEAQQNIDEPVSHLTPSVINEPSQSETEVGLFEQDIQFASFRKQLEFGIRLNTGKLRFKEYRSLAQRARRRYRMRFGAPKSPQQLEAWGKEVERRKRKSKAAKLARKRQRSK